MRIEWEKRLAATALSLVVACGISVQQSSAAAPPAATETPATSTATDVDEIGPDGEPLVKKKPKSYPMQDLSKLLSEATPGKGFKYVSSVRYSPYFKQSFGDLYLPPGDTASGAKRPCVLVVHGGAWILGSRIDPGEADIAQRLARHGYVTFSIDYRLIQQGGNYPKSIQDVEDALGFLEANADKLGIDTERVGVYGGSAGATMALLVSYAPKTVFEPQFYKTSTLKPKVAVVYAPVTDMRNLELTWLFRYIGDTPYHSPEKFAQASPITYVNTAVPTCIVSGTADQLVPYQQSQSLFQALQQAKVPAALYPMERCRHVFHEDPGPTRETSYKYLQSFFDKYLNPRSSVPTG